MFPYTITDVGTGLNASAFVHIVIPAPVALLAVNNSFVGEFNTPYTPGSTSLIVLDDASNNDNPQLEVVDVGAPTPGSGSITSWDKNGSFVFEPTPGWSGRPLPFINQGLNPVRMHELAYRSVHMVLKV